jgi:hypothetical protein
MEVVAVGTVRFGLVNRLPWPMRGPKGWYSLEVLDAKLV